MGSVGLQDFTGLQAAFFLAPTFFLDMGVKGELLQLHTDVFSYLDVPKSNCGQIGWGRRRLEELCITHLMAA